MWELFVASLLRPKPFRRAPNVAFHHQRGKSQLQWSRKNKLESFHRRRLAMFWDKRLHCAAVSQQFSSLNHAFRLQIYQRLNHRLWCLVGCNCKAKQSGSDHLVVLTIDRGVSPQLLFNESSSTSCFEATTTLATERLVCSQVDEECWVNV